MSSLPRKRHESNSPTAGSRVGQENLPQFLGALYHTIPQAQRAELLVEIAWLPASGESEGGLPAKGFRLSDLDEAAAEAVKLNTTANVYYGLNPRRAAWASKKSHAATEEVAAIVGLCVDDPQEQRAALEKALPPPSFVIETSPGKFQGIWLLRGEAIFRGSPAWDQAMQLQADLRHHLHAEAGDIVRVLRCPHTRNLKYDPPAEVRLFVIRKGQLAPWDGDPEHIYRYVLEELARLMLPTKTELNRAEGEEKRPHVGYKDLPLGGKYCLRRAFQEGIEQSRRNNAGITLASELRKLKKGQDVALKFLHEWNRRNRPPLADRELEKVVESAFKRPKPYDFGCKEYRDRLEVDQETCNQKCTWLKEARQQAREKHQEERDSQRSGRKSFKGRGALLNWTAIRAIRLTEDGRTLTADEERGAFIMSQRPPLPQDARVGVLEPYIEFLRENSEISATFAFATLRNLLGLAIGRSLRVAYGLQWQSPIFYDALIGPAGFGRKDTAIFHATEVIDHATRVRGEEPRYLTIHGAGSAEGLLNQLAGAPGATALLQIGEFSQLLDKAAQQATANLIGLLNALWQLPPRAQNVTRKEPITVDKPTMGILAGSAIPNIIETFNKRAIEGGFMSRFSWWLPDPDGRLVSYPESERAKPTWIQGVHEALDFAEEMASKLGGKGYPIAPSVIEAGGLWDNFYREFRNRYDEESPHGGVISRIPDQIWRHALLFAVLLRKEEIDEDVLGRAISIGLYLEKTALSVRGQLEETPERRLQRRIFDLLNTAGGEIEKRSLHQKCGPYGTAEEIRLTLGRLADLGFVELVGDRG